MRVQLRTRISDQRECVKSALYVVAAGAKPFPAAAVDYAAAQRRDAVQDSFECTTIRGSYFEK